MKLNKFLHTFQQGKCYRCGGPLTIDRHKGWMKDPNHATRDHIRPRLGGRGFTSACNVLLAHGECNKRRGAKRPTACELFFVREAFEIFKKIRPDYNVRQPTRYSECG